jgi:transposase
LDRFFTKMAKKGKGRPKKHNYSRLSPQEQGEIIGYIKLGWGDRQIGRAMGRDHRTIGRIRKQYKAEGKVEEKERSGRPRITTAAEDRALKYRSLKNRRLAAPALRLTMTTKQGKRPGIQTVKNRLREMGLNGRVAAKKPLINWKHQLQRIAFAKKYKDWTVDDWKKVIFSDESPFTLIPRSGKVYVRRRTGERFLPECLKPTVKFGGGKIQVWGCFSYNKVGPLKRVEGKLTGARYREILKNHMAPFLRKLKKENKMNYIFQQDNDPKHTSKVAKKYLKNTNVVMLDWPSVSPDLNPIENVWKHLKDKLAESYEKASNLDHLFQLVKQAWAEIDINYLHSVVESMPRRCAAVIKARGMPTKY